MIIFPAIDLLGGRCVRLYQGDFDTAHGVADDPVETALRFKAAGATWIHMVDLDGARSGAGENRELCTRVANETGLCVQLGGGIRDMQTVESCLELGISRVVIGSAAVEDEAFASEAIQRYGDKIAIGIDARDGLVKSRGWVQDSGIHFIALAGRMAQLGARHIIYTDISRDGMQTGVNLSHIEALMRETGALITASGGVGSILDIKALLSLGAYGVICGKALYEGTLSLQEAITLSNNKCAREDT